MPAGGSKYFQISPIRRRDTGADIDRGLQAGAEVGKLLGGLAGAIKGAQKDALANKLMNTEDAPRAALVSPGSRTVTTPGTAGIPGSGGADADPDPDYLYTNPDPGTFTNPTTGNVEPLQGPDTSQRDLEQAVAQARLENPAIPATAPTGPTTSYVPNAMPAGVSTAGTQPHRGGVQEIDLQKEMLAMQLSKQGQQEKVAAAQAKAADEAAQAAGTGKYALETAQRRATLERTRQEIEAAKNPKAVKEGPAVNIDSEPVTSQEQLNKHINGIYGDGVAEGLVNLVSDGTTDPSIDPNTKKAGPILMKIGTRNVSIPLLEAQIYIKQQNAIRRTQGLPLFRVPGEDQNLGKTPNLPYPARTNLDVYSRAPGGYMTLPNGTFVQVPEAKRKR